MGFTEKIKDFGRQVMGEGPEVDFKNEAAEFAEANHITLEEAQRELFFDRTGNLQMEAKMGGSINSTENLRNFQAALNEMFDAQTLEQFRTDSEDPTIYNDPALAPLDKKDYNRTADYFKKNYDGQEPNFNVVRDSTENLQLINELLVRLNGSRGSAGSFTSLEAFLKRYPELGADIGKCLSAQELNDTHERTFNREINLDQAMERLKEDSKSSLGEMFWKAPTECLGKVLKYGFNPNFGNIAKMTYEIGRLAGREFKAGGKLLISAGRAAGSYLNTMRK